MKKANTRLYDLISYYRPGYLVIMSADGSEHVRYDVHTEIEAVDRISDCVFTHMYTENGIMFILDGNYEFFARSHSRKGGDDKHDQQPAHSA